MKLLLDENLSFRLCRHLADHFEEVRHVREFDLLHADDRLIWEFAKRNGYSVVTQDREFVGRVIVDGAPPKVVWIRLSNAPVRGHALLMLDATAKLTGFDRDPEAAYLELPPSDPLQ